MSDQTLTTSPSPKRALTLRAVLLGFALVLLVSILPPYSDYIRDNTFLIGNHLPVLVIATITALMLVINPLLKERRFGRGEMAVAIAMMLISCSLPSSGFYRYFQPQLASPIYSQNTYDWYKAYLDTLPDWLVPAKEAEAKSIRDFWHGIDPRSADTPWTELTAWLMPYAAWAFFIVPLLLGVMFLCALMRRQWVDGERLAFPLVQVQLELMSEPAAGERLPPLWKNKLFWLGVLIPVGVHLINGAAQFNTSIPKIPVSYNLDSAFSDPPWSVLPLFVKKNDLFFSVIGVTFFVQLPVAFSIWFFFLCVAVMNVLAYESGYQITIEHYTAHGLGMYIAYGLLLLFIARHHLMHVLKTLLKPREAPEFTSYATSLSGLIICSAVAIGFMTVAGMTWWFALITFALIMLWLVILTRIVAESGVLFVQSAWGTEPLRLMAHFLSQTATDATHKIELMRHWLLNSITTHLAITDQRENVMPFAANALRLGHEVENKRRPRFFMLLCVALIGTLLVSGATHHYLSYSFGRSNFDIGGHGYKGFPEGTMNVAREAAEPERYPAKIDRNAHMAGGAAAMTAVGLTRVYFTSSPFHPIGLLLYNSYAVQRIWFSVMIAWAIKLIIMRWGGAKMFTVARNFFLGLIVGEAMIAIFWATVGLFINWPNPSNPFQVLPG